MEFNSGFKGLNMFAREDSRKLFRCIFH